MTETMDLRQPGEAFCADCPDHEACSTGYPCSFVQRTAREAHATTQAAARDADRELREGASDVA